MDVDTIKLVLIILYLTLLVIVALVWFRLVHTPNGELYRKVRLQGGYMPLSDGDIEVDADTFAQPGALVQS
ncbi:MAG: hypothetical protein JWQ01_2922 [Massilia sp.]|jgi:hypothetical protein|nr:hypothetical protein [Massilia sp.]